MRCENVRLVEATFDMDADGILYVSVKDINQEQKITIKFSSGLSDAEIEQMVQYVEANKAFEEAGDALASDEKEKIEVAIKDFETVTKVEDKTEIEAKTASIS